MAGTIHFEGTCDVCEAPISIDWNFAQQGTIDYNVQDDGKLVTWIRHLDGTDMRCRIYSSTVYEVSRS